MPTSQAMAVWEGKLKDGNGTFKAGSSSFNGPYSFATRFEGKKGTNPEELIAAAQDRKSTRLNSSHSQISYAVFCLKKKKQAERALSEGASPGATVDACSASSGRASARPRQGG